MAYDTYVKASAEVINECIEKMHTSSARTYSAHHLRIYQDGLTFFGRIINHP